MHYQRVDRTLKSYARSPRRQYFQVTSKPSENQNHNRKHMRHESSEGEICALLFFAQLRRGCVVTPLQKEDQKIFTPLFCQPSNWPCIRFQQMGWSRNVAWSSPSRRISKTSCISSPHLNRCERVSQCQGNFAVQKRLRLAPFWQ